MSDSPGQALRKYLMTKAGVTALIAARMYPGFEPQGAAHPSITYTAISDAHTRSMAGSSQQARSRVQLTCWASDYTAAQALKETVRLVVDGYAGAMGDLTIQAAFFEGGSDTTYESPELEGATLYGASTDVILWHAEAAPTL